MIKGKITRSEWKEKRTANHKVFENQDHSRTVEIYMEPVHYEDEDGNDISEDPRPYIFVNGDKEYLDHYMRY